MIHSPHPPVAARRDPPSPQRGEGWGEGDSEHQSARLCLGVITGAHGVKGLVRIKSFTAEPDAIASYGALQDESGARRFALELVGAVKGVLLARIAGVADRDAAERLKGLRLYVERAALPEPEPDEFYEADLIGLEAHRADGARLGIVREVYDFGAGASIEIANESGKTLLVPFTAAAVPEIDIAGGKLVVVPPAELVAAPDHHEDRHDDEVREPA